MANLRVSTPKFYIDAVLLARQWGMVDLTYFYGHYDKFFNLNPSNVSEISGEEGSIYAYRGTSFKKRYFSNSISHCFILGHNFLTENIQVQVKLLDDTNFRTLLDTTPTELNGWTKFPFDAATEVDYNNILITFINETTDATSISTQVGDISLGWSYAMQHSSDLELTQSFSNESIKTQTTKGGHSLSNAGYNQQPKWIRPAWSRGTKDSYDAFLNDFRVYPSGRRSWNLKFSYLSDLSLNDSGDNVGLFPSKYNSDFGIFEYTGAIADPNPDDEVDESASMYSIKKDFLSKVYHGTNNFQNSFLFQPNQAEEEYAICRINGDTASFNQVANNVYDVSLDITEVW